jgi:hypothetical protein
MKPRLWAAILIGSYLLTTVTSAGGISLEDPGMMQAKIFYGPRKSKQIDGKECQIAYTNVAFVRIDMPNHRGCLTWHKGRKNTCKLQLRAGVLTSFKCWLITKLRIPWLRDAPAQPNTAAQAVQSLSTASASPLYAGTKKKTRPNSDPSSSSYRSRNLDDGGEEGDGIPGIRLRPARSEEEETGPESNFSAALWTCEPTTFSFFYDNQESHLILEGEVLVTPLGNVSPRRT